MNKRIHWMRRAGWFWLLCVSFVGTPKAEEAALLLRILPSTDITLDGGDGDKPALFQFTLENRSKKAIVIERITSSCQCTVLKLSEGKIESGESLKVEGHIAPPFRSGRNVNTIFLQTDCPGQEVVALAVDVNFAQRVRFDPATLDFRNLNPGEQRTATLRIYYPDDNQNLMLIEAESRHPNVTVPTSVLPKIRLGGVQIAEFPVTVTAAEISTEIVMKFSDSFHSRFQHSLPVRIGMKKAVSLSSSSVFLSSATSSKKITASIDKNYLPGFRFSATKVANVPLLIETHQEQEGQIAINFDLSGETSGLTHGSFIFSLNLGEEIGITQISVFWVVPPKTE